MGNQLRRPTYIILISNMKVATFNQIMVLGLLVVLVATGCVNKRREGVTPLPGREPGIVGSQGPNEAMPPREASGGGRLGSDSGVEGSNLPVNEEGNIANAPLPLFENRPVDYETFEEHTVYFDFDSSVVNTTEVWKIRAVADYLQNAPGNDLVIEGHCDERGTEEYNRALGERRAQAVREFLSNLGISPARIRTMSYGEDDPAVEGTTEAAYAKNRRAVFGLLFPAQE